MTAHNRKARALLVAAGLAAMVLPAFAQRAAAPGPTGLSPEVLSLACNPTLVHEAPMTPLRLTGSQESFVRTIFAPGDLVTINAGTNNGIEVGQEFFTRRLMPLQRRAISRNNPATVRTTGWIRVYAVDDEMSLATVTFACDSLQLNDYLEPFAAPTIPTISTDTPKPQRDNYARIVIGNENRASFGRGDAFVVDQGSDHGITVGAQFVVYRDKREAGHFLFELGEAVAIDVRPESSTIRATLARDAFAVGDLVALRKQSGSTRPSAR